MNTHGRTYTTHAPQVFRTTRGVCAETYDTNRRCFKKTLNHNLLIWRQTAKSPHPQVEVLARDSAEDAVPGRSDISSDGYRPSCFLSEIVEG